MGVDAGSPVAAPLALGTVPLGNYRRAIADADADAVVERAWERGIRAFDTAPLYGSGLAETRLGRALAGRPRDEYVLSTKVGNVLSEDAPPRPDLLDHGVPIYRDVPALGPVVDFRRDAVLRSLEESMARLGTDRFDIVYLHDPLVDTPHVLDEAYPVLDELRSQGVVGAIGIGGSDIPAFLGIAHEARIDAMLVASRLTLLDRSGAGELLDLCRAQGIAIVAGAVFNSGILAAPDPATASFGYKRATPDVVARVEQLRALCARFGVPPIAAAIRFPLRFDGVGSVVVGAASTVELDADVDAAVAPIPDEFWNAVDAGDSVR
jgi:D-threo-aldose 1-dehydrogenase